MNQFWNSLPERWSNYSKLRQGKPLDLTWLLQTNDNLRNAHILVLYPVRDLTYVWKILPGGRIASWETLPITRQAVTRLNERMLSVFENRQSIPEECEELCEHLASCIEAYPASATVCIVPGGPFISFPFATLRSSGQYWIERNPLVLMPSLSVMSYWGTTQATKPQTTALVLGDSLGDLPHARKEAATVARLLHTKPHIGEAVSRSLVRIVLPSVGLLHVACHTYYNGEDPASSGFLLTDRTVCSARDLHQIVMNARLTVLSACESGIQYLKEGDENIGLAASLLHAGVPSVVATLWKISDKATLDLMKRFYEELRLNGGNAAEALRVSQCEVLSKQGRTDPYYWAAFQLHGRWENILI